MMKLCRTCRFGSEYELDKPCIVYREDCPLYEKEGDGMTGEEAIKTLKGEAWINCQEKWFEALDMAIKALEQEPSGETVSLEAFKQVMRERDIAIEQLHELGYNFGQKIEPCGDAISREAVLDELNKWDWQELYLPIHFKENIIDVVPSVRPQEPKTDVLDKIRAEIEQSISRYSISKERGGMGQVEWSDRLIKESDVFEIIDKYMAESDHKCHTCKHYTSGEYDGSCDSYICKGYSDWESEDKR